MGVTEVHFIVKSRGGAMFHFAKTRKRVELANTRVSGARDAREHS